MYGQYTIKVGNNPPFTVNNTITNSFAVYLNSFLVYNAHNNPTTWRLCNIEVGTSLTIAVATPALGNQIGVLSSTAAIYFSAAVVTTYPVAVLVATFPTATVGGQNIREMGVFTASNASGVKILGSYIDSTTGFSTLACGANDDLTVYVGWQVLALF